jgi:hypothetical protein
MNEPARTAYTRFFNPKPGCQVLLENLLKMEAGEESGAICMELCCMPQVTTGTWYHLMPHPHL